MVGSEFIPEVGTYSYMIDFLCNGSLGTSAVADNNFFLSPKSGINEPTSLSTGNSYSFRTTLPTGGIILPFNDTRLRFFLRQRRPTGIAGAPNYSMSVTAGNASTAIFINYFLHN